MSDDPVQEAELIIMRAHAADSLNRHADTIDKMVADVARLTDHYDGDPVMAFSKLTTQIFDQVGDNPRFLCGLAAALAVRAAGLELRS